MYFFAFYFLLILFIISSIAAFYFYRRISKEKFADKAKKHFLEITLRSIEEGVLVTDSDGNILFFNHIVENLIGYSWKEINHKNAENYLNLYEKGTDRRLINPINKVLGTGEVQISEKNCVIRSKNDEEYDVTYTASMLDLLDINHVSGKKIGIVVIFRDITKNNRKKDSLRNFAKKVSMAIEIGKLEVWEYDPATGDVTYLNGFLGEFDSENIVEKDFGRKLKNCERYSRAIERVLPEFRQRVSTAFRRLVSGETSMLNTQYQTRYSNGELHWLSLVATRQQTTDNTIKIVGFSRDITEQKTAQFAIERERDVAKSMKHNSEILTESIRHEVKHPIDNILLYLAELANNPPKNRTLDIASNITTSINSIESLLNKTDELVETLNSPERTLKNHKRMIHPNMIIDNIERILAPEFKNQGIEFKRAVAADSPLIYIDEVYLQQVLMNLTTNALQFSHDGFVKISFSCINKNENRANIIFTVEDTGIGMSQEQLDNMLENSDLKNIKSLDDDGHIGFPLAKVFANAIGATLSGESIINCGTKFHITIFEVKIKREEFQNLST